MKPFVVVLAGIAIALASLAARVARPQSSGEAAAPPRVLLVTLDTTRADRIGCYGAKQARTPGIDALAAKGVTYEQAWTTAPITLPAHATILSGVLPCEHGVRDNVIFEVADDARLLAEAFRDAGFRTGAFVGTFILDRKFGLDQGFEVYDQPDASRQGFGIAVIDRPATIVAERAIAFVDALKPDDRFFLWVHFYDPHSPHEVEPGFAQPGEDLYDAEIALCDRELRRILERLRARGLDAGLTTLVTADHGESNGEHHEETHGTFVYDSSMRVPLVVAPPPPGVAPGTKLREPVSTADVAATLLERAGVGRALLPAARSPLLPSQDPAEPGASDRALYLEAFLRFHQNRWHPLRAIVWKGHKYVQAPRPELYDLVADAHETQDLASSKSELASRFATRLAALLEEHPPLDWHGERAISSADAAHAASLGYVSGSIAGDPTDPSLPDPKDRIGDLALYDRVTGLTQAAKEALGLGVGLRTGRRPQIAPEQRAQGEKLLAEARAALTTIRTANPADPSLDQIDAAIALDLGDYVAAVAPLERAVTANPRSMPLHYNLAVAYANTGRPEWGRREMEKAIYVEPGSLAPHRWLVQFCVNQRDWAAAAWWATELQKCEGQTQADLQAGVRDRARILDLLAQSGAGAPRPPRPVTDEELAPEGIRNGEAAR